MKIQEINTYTVQLPLTYTLTVAYSSKSVKEIVFVEILTDDGLKGYGEASPSIPVTGENSMTVRAAVEHFKSHLIGRDPLEFKTLINEIDRSIVHNSSAKAGIDIALHDLVAQYYRIPLKLLFGGQCRDKVVTSLTAWIGTISETTERVKALLERGAKVIKLKVGLDLDQDIERVKTIRDVCGYDFRLRTDANQGYTPKQAVTFLEKTEPYCIEFMEQPTVRWDISGLKYVTQHSPIPIMADEAIHAPSDVIRLIKEEACDLINIKVMKAGGLLRASEIATIAQSAGIGCMLGAMVETKIGMGAATHLAYSHPNILYADLDGHVYLAEDPTLDGVETVDGCNYVSDNPGIGVDIDKVTMRKYLVS